MWSARRCFLIFRPAYELSNHPVRLWICSRCIFRWDSRLYIGCETPRTVSLEGIMRGFSRTTKGTIMAVQESTVINANVEQVIEAFPSRTSHASPAPRLALNSAASPFPVTSAEFIATTDVSRSMRAGHVVFVGNGAVKTQVDTVSAPAADGSRTVSTEVKVTGIPVSAQATQKLDPPRVSRPAWTSTVISCPSRWWQEDCSRC